MPPRVEEDPIKQKPCHAKPTQTFTIYNILFVIIVWPPCLILPTEYCICILLVYYSSCLLFFLILSFSHNASVYNIEMHYIQVSTLQSAWNDMDLLWLLFFECWSYISKTKKLFFQRDHLESGLSVCVWFVSFSIISFVSCWALVVAR